MQWLPSIVDGGRAGCVVLQRSLHSAHNMPCYHRISSHDIALTYGNRSCRCRRQTMHTTRQLSRVQRVQRGSWRKGTLQSFALGNSFGSTPHKNGRSPLDLHRHSPVIGFSSACRLVERLRLPLPQPAPATPSQDVRHLSLRTLPDGSRVSIGDNASAALSLLVERRSRQASIP